MKRFTIFCQRDGEDSQNEAVTFDIENPALMIDVYEQEDGMLVNVKWDIFNVEALFSKKCSALELMDKLHPDNGNCLECDKLFVGTMNEGYDDDEEDEGEDEEDSEW